ncbi:hypothetical protein ACLOJK_024238 [Asimina triloba]
MGFQPKDFSRGRLGTDRWWTLMVDRRNRTLDLGRWVLAVGFRNPQLEGDADDTVDRYLGSLDLGDRWISDLLVDGCLRWVFNGCHGSEVEFFVAAWTAAGGQGLRDLDGSR